MTGYTISRPKKLTSPAVTSTNPIPPNRDPDTPHVLVPVTKVPALDTIDQYAADKSTGDVIGQGPRIRLLCSDDPVNVVDDILHGYARFVSRFTGLDDVAFAVLRQGVFASASVPTRAVICASLSASESEEGTSPMKLRQCRIHKVDYIYNKPGEVQFSLQLGSAAGSENGQQHDPFGANEEVCLYKKH